MSDFRVLGPDGKGELTLAGSLTIENASAIRKKLITALMREEAVGFFNIPGYVRLIQNHYMGE